MNKPDPFYVVGQKYKMLGYKDKMTLVGMDDVYAKFVWMCGLKYHVTHNKRHSFLYRAVA
jgi:hypothetical protein